MAPGNHAADPGDRGSLSFERPPLNVAPTPRISRALSPSLSTILDASRALCAALVVAQHTRIAVFADRGALLPTEMSMPVAAAYFLTSMGHPSVIVFFVISGFLVGGSLLMDVADQRLNLGRYAINRFARVYTVLTPALLLGYAMDALRARFAESVVHKASLELGPISPTILIGNLASLQTIYVPFLGSNAPLWSLANEVWYYVLAPVLLVAAIGRPAWQRVACAVIAMIVIVMTYPSILSYFPFWMAGAVARVMPRPLVKHGLVALVAVVVTFAGNRFGRGVLHGWLTDALTSFAFASWLLTSRFADTPQLGDAVARAIEPTAGANMARGFAAFSFSLYATHMPFLVLVSTLAARFGGVRLNAAPTMGSTVFALALFAAAYLWAWSFASLTEKRTENVRAALIRSFGGLRVRSASAG